MKHTPYIIFLFFSSFTLPSPILVYHFSQIFLSFFFTLYLCRTQCSLRNHLVLTATQRIRTQEARHSQSPKAWGTTRWSLPNPALLALAMTKSRPLLQWHLWHLNWIQVNTLIILWHFQGEWHFSFGIQAMTPSHLSRPEWPFP